MIHIFICKLHRSRYIKKNPEKHHGKFNIKSDTDVEKTLPASLNPIVQQIAVQTSLS